jgi:ABC-type amino acid transport substrate-binding protein
MAIGIGISVPQADQPFPPDIRRIKERGKIVVAQCTINQRGFYWFDNAGAYRRQPSFTYHGKRLVGFDIAMALEIAKALDVELELNRSTDDFSAVCLQVARGEADIAISKLSITLERAQYVRFTKPYAVLGVGLLVNRFLAARAGLKEDLPAQCNRPDRRLGVWEGTAAQTYARELFPKADLRLYDTYEQLVQAVLDREILACVDEDFELRLSLLRQPGLAMWVRFVQVSTIKDRLGIAVAHRSPNLLAFLNLFLEHREVKFDLEQLLRKSSSVETMTPEGADHTTKRGPIRTHAVK